MRMKRDYFMLGWAGSLWAAGHEHGLESCGGGVFVVVWINTLLLFLVESSFIVFIPFQFHHFASHYILFEHLHTYVQKKQFFFLFNNFNSYIFPIKHISTFNFKIVYIKQRTIHHHTTHGLIHVYT